MIRSSEANKLVGTITSIEDDGVTSSTEVPTGDVMSTSTAIDNLIKSEASGFIGNTDANGIKTFGNFTDISDVISISDTVGIISSTNIISQTDGFTSTSKTDYILNTSKSDEDSSTSEVGIVTRAFDKNSFSSFGASYVNSESSSIVSHSTLHNVVDTTKVISIMRNIETDGVTSNSETPKADISASRIDIIARTSAGGGIISTAEVNSFGTSGVSDDISEALGIISKSTTGIVVGTAETVSTNSIIETDDASRTVELSKTNNTNSFNAIDIMNISDSDSFISTTKASGISIFAINSTDVANGKSSSDTSTIINLTDVSVNSSVEVEGVFTSTELASVTSTTKAGNTISASETDDVISTTGARGINSSGTRHNLIEASNVLSTSKVIDVTLGTEPYGAFNDTKVGRVIDNIVNETNEFSSAINMGK